jgi:GcrA cell cycle regulator
MGWDAEDVALLKKLWAAGRSAAQIARRLGYSRNAVCAKLTRLDLKRGHKPPTAKPKIRPVPKRKSALLAACTRPVDRIVSTRKPGVRQPEEFTKSQLKATLAEAAANTARLPRCCVQRARDPGTIRSMDMVAIGTVVLTSRRRRTTAGIPRKTVRRLNLMRKSEQNG